jgi:hypothetical protein
MNIKVMTNYKRKLDISKIIEDRDTFFLFKELFFNKKLKKIKIKINLYFYNQNIKKYYFLY